MAGALLAVTLLAGCSDNKPTEPIPGWVFQGILTPGERQNHFFSMPESDVVRITLVEVRPILIEVPPIGVPGEIVLGVALGRLTGGDDGGLPGCSVTLPLPARVGGTILVALNQREYCVTVWDPNNLPPDGIVEYTVTVDPQN